MNALIHNMLELPEPLFSSRTCSSFGICVDIVRCVIFVTPAVGVGVLPT